MFTIDEIKFGKARQCKYYASISGTKFIFGAALILNFSITRKKWYATVSTGLKIVSGELQDMKLSPDVKLSRATFASVEGGLDGEIIVHFEGYGDVVLPSIGSPMAVVS